MSIEPTRGFDWWRLLPHYWIQGGRTDRAWDAVLNRLLDEHGISSVSRYEARVGSVPVWVSNWPYDFGKHCGGSCPLHGLPLVRTRKRLRQAVLEHSLSKALNTGDTHDRGDGQ